MSALSDAITAVGTSVDAATVRVQTDVAAFQQKIADLQAIIDSGTYTQADVDALAALQAKVDAIDPTSPVVLPTG